MTKKRTMPIRIKVIDLNDDWQGWQFEARTNPTMGTLGDLSSGEFVRIISGLAETVQGWNFVDEEGEPLPNPAETQNKVDLIEKIPYDLAIAMANALSKEIATIPGN